MIMPDVIYAKIISAYEICCPACWLNQWDDSDNKDGSEPYYSQSKVDELLERIKQLEDIISRASQKLRESAQPFDNGCVILMEAKIGDSDE